MRADVFPDVSLPSPDGSWSALLDYVGEIRWGHRTSSSASMAFPSSTASSGAMPFGVPTLPVYSCRSG